MTAENHIGNQADSASLPANPLIDGNIHYGTVQNIAHVLEFIASSEDIPPGLWLTLVTVIGAVRHLAQALKPVAEVAP